MATDIGGTFTDLVGVRDGRIVAAKSSTTPDDPTQGVAHTLEAVSAETRHIREFFHGTTISINTVLELKGARTALLTTEGFRDVYAIGRSNRPEAFNLNFRRPRPLVPRALSFEVAERMNAKGDVLTPLDAADLAAVAEELKAQAVEAIAVCFLHAYANPAHEVLAGAVLRDAVPGLFVTLSHEILREYREYERTSTTALNAYVGPRVQAYLDRLDSYLSHQSFAGKVQIMRSNGGTMSFSEARAQPVAMMESGPVAGMIGAAELAQLFEIEKCIGFDMGGTTAKSSLITGGELDIQDGYFIGGYASGQPMQLPVADIVEVGAGGGSIAWCDTLGAMHVGPESAGADPGPACYGLGGTDPVVTDADLVLGRLNGARFLGGGMDLDYAAAETAIKEKLADPLGLGVAEGATGITEIVDAAMSLAIRAVSVERGCDPRDCTLIAFGGAGPLHSVSLAREIFIPRVIVPKFPGNFSALGMLLAAWRQDLVQTFVADLQALDTGRLAREFASLGEAARGRMAAEGMAEAEFAYAADLRYRGQEHTLPVPVGGAGDFAPERISVLRDAFDALHEQRYGHADRELPLQLVHLRLTLTAARDRALVADWLAQPHMPEDGCADETRDVIYAHADGPVPARILWRPGLAAGAEIEGPAVIEEPNSTTLLFPGDRAVISEHGHIVIEVGSQGDDA